MTDREGVTYTAHMQHLRTVGLGSVLALSLLSACAAADPLASSSATAQPGRPVSTGVFGDFLAGRFALSQSDPNAAATAFLKALAASPADPELLRQAFVASVMSGRPEALSLARQLPDNPVAQLLLGDADARSGDWASAERRFRALPRQGLTQLLRPLLVAWSQAGAGQTDAALATLRPFVAGQRFRGIFALHAGMIADLGGDREDAARFYASAQSEMPQMNLRLAQILASWQARSGQPAAAQRTLAALADGSPDMTIAVPALEANSATRPVARATDGIAEAYLALGGALRSQDSRDYAMVMLRLALDLRPGLTAARLLAADLLSNDGHENAALRMLASVPANDPLNAVIRMRRVGIAVQAGRTDEALRELDRIAAAYPDSPLPPIQRGDILRSKQRYNEAIAAYTDGIARLGQPGPEDWPAFYDRGIAYEAMHEQRKAEADFRQALQLSPDQPYVLNYLGYFWANKDERLAEAQRMIQTAAEREPDDGAITDSLGWVMLREGHVGEAVQLLERAVELEPEDPTINGHLGDAYAAAGRALEAKYQWQRALTLNPGPADTATLEAKLRTPPAASVASGRQ
ncbi:MAG TPA: tetratricopeptide repeat protein [Acetobacteraceae bacterium]|nr:tetratricopeptide repeat protein [Acetobacteraceae bacterium]